MFFKISFFFLYFLSAAFFARGQTENYSIKKAPFSTEKYDEFSPVFYRKGIVFCSNRNSGLFLNVTTADNKNLFKIYYSDVTGKQAPELLSGNLSSQFNDGPVTFSASGDTIYFSRNIISGSNPRSASDPRNKLGIFFAVRSGDKWINITELRFNSDSYNITTPWLSKDGKRLYFASDKPGGFGGSDLYYCEKKDNYWNNPVNLGNTINTGGNEAYPFVNSAGELFFSSDGHPGQGRKDIFYSKYTDSVWIEPVRLNPPINSEFDDFGFISDEGMTEGYFASKRGRSVDIYSFKTLIPQFFYCTGQKENRYCFSFQDDMSIDIDPVNLQFTWDFGDGKTETGYLLQHCYPGPGIYSVKQNIIERKTGRIVFNKVAYDLKLKEAVQPFITYDVNPSSNADMVFSGSKSYLPGFDILSWSWDFGDGTGSDGAMVSHSFKGPGEYNIKLGVQAKEIKTGTIRSTCVSEKIILPAVKADSSGKKKNVLPEVQNYENAEITYLYSSSHDLEEKAIFQVELMTSKTRISDVSIFSKLTPRYSVKEIFLPGEDLFSYVTDESLTLMDLYPAFNDASSLNFRNVRIKTFVPTDPAEKEFWNIKRLYPTPADLFFDRDDSRLKQGDFIVLEQIAVFLKKNPQVRIEIASHTDNSATPEISLKLSQNRAVSISNYLERKGISRERLKPSGYGSTKPVASNYSEADRKKNRRIDFLMVK